MSLSSATAPTDPAAAIPCPKPEPKPVPKPEPKPVPKPEPKPVPKPEPKPVPKPEPKPVHSPDTAESALVQVSKILMIVGTIATCVGLFWSIVIPTVGLGFLLGFLAAIPLLWCVPMIKHYSNSVRSGIRITTAFKVCVLLFVSLPAGIVMLCDNEH